MSNELPTNTHSAEDAALGFYYQAFFAFLTLLEQTSDNAAVGMERLDDVELKVDGHLLLYQLKHSIKEKPPAITLKSRALWRTVKVWVDVLPNIELSETTLHLVTVGEIATTSGLGVLTTIDTDRQELVALMTIEAETVRGERAAAVASGISPPHAERAAGCEAFLSLATIDRQNLMRRVLICPKSPNVADIEPLAIQRLTLIRPENRPEIAKRLLSWWDTEVVYALCGIREPIISRAELQAKVTSFVGDLENGKLQADFELQVPPGDYQPDGMLARQINLVDGGNSDLSRAIREEWRAREQRAKWVSGNPAMASVVTEYDRLLEEAWSDRHSQMAEDCKVVPELAKRKRGLELLRWTHNEAPTKVRPIAESWSTAYYVRGTFQVLAIDRRVGWHPEYIDLLKGDE